jgi:hypothetical protein
LIITKLDFSFFTGEFKQSNIAATIGPALVTTRAGFVLQALRSPTGGQYKAVSFSLGWHCEICKSALNQAFNVIILDVTLVEL